jgi:CHAD domain-containing protein
VLALREGLQRVYARGRRAQRKARRHPTVENLHDWRKSVKHLWYAASVLREAGPDELGEARGQARELSELLGTDHDLAVLRDAVQAHRGAFARGRDRKALVARIDRRRAKLTKRALRIGGELYARKPARAGKRLGSGWKRRLAQE